MQPQGFALIAVAALAALAATPVSCGSSAHGTGGGAGSTPQGSGGSDGSGGTTTTTQKPPKDSCGQPGDKGNNLGIGTYCTPGGEQCRKFPKAGLCLADVGEDQWFCTFIGCTKDSQCGDDTTCVIHSDGSACVPNRCLDGSSTGSGGAGGSSTTPTGGGSGGTSGSGGSGGTPN